MQNINIKKRKIENKKKKKFIQKANGSRFILTPMESEASLFHPYHYYNIHFHLVLKYIILL